MGAQAYLWRGGDDDDNCGDGLIGDKGGFGERGIELDEFKGPGTSFLVSFRFGDVVTKGKHNRETDLGVFLAGEP